MLGFKGDKGDKDAKVKRSIQGQGVLKNSSQFNHCKNSLSEQEYNLELLMIVSCPITISVL